MVSKNPKIVACNRMPIQRLFRFLNSLLVVIILKPMDVSAREKLRPELHSCSQVIEEIVNTISENPTHSVVGIMKQRMKGKTLISLEFKNSLAERFGEKITKELVTNYSITDLTHLSNSYDILVRLKKLNLISQLEVGKFDLNTFESFKTNFSEHVHFRLFSEEKGIVIKRLENRCYDLVGGKTSSSELLNLVRKNLNNSLLYVKQNPVLLVFIVIFALILQEYLLTKGKKKIFFNNGNKLLDNLYQFISDLSVDSGKYFPNRSQSRELEKKVASKKENLKNLFKNKPINI
jgi:hypothetical protein